MDSPAAVPPTAGISLRQLLMSLGEPLVELQTAPAGLDVEIRSVALLDPEDPPVAHPGELVLAIGARGRAAFPALRAAGRDGAAAVAVKLDAPGQAAALSETAADAGVALLSVRGDARWDQVDAIARAALDDAPVDGSGESADDAAEGDLFSLAQTTAMLTGGIVSIEDTAHRVLAYSRSADHDEADDLRRQSILGWQGPEAYLARLREWGVFQRLRTSDDVINVDSHPELGIRRRLAIAIRSGDRQLGTIWVQEGSTPLTERSDQALLGAARVAALHLVRRRRELSADVTLARTLAAGLLEGSSGPQPLASHLGLDAARPAAVLGFSYGAAEATGPELTRAEVTNLISVHTAARHRAALVTEGDHRIYVLLPQLPRSIDIGTLRGWGQDIADTARRHLGLPLRGSIGCIVPGLGKVPDSRREADRILDAMVNADVATTVAALPDIQAEVLVSEMLALLADRPDMRDPRLTAVTDHDSRHQGRLAESILAYLNAFGDVRAAAAQLHVHPNTVRYRIGRAEQLTGLDLSRPDQRLLAMLQLRLPG
ncbi:helix-turn-helix domain-containing protein [Streptomyces sp. NPDC086554]|uniref:PucR family transcriptional regulator n=1 Tax=Streptomyces sp. NPDC086554 TaxID=3154864 RepID=UPI00342322D3